MNEQSVPVGLGELKISRTAGEVLVAYGLGSCVAVCAYDPAGRIAGMLHVLLPEYTGDDPLQATAKFANTGVRLLVETLSTQGALKSRLLVKIAGGATVLQGTGAVNVLTIGERNIKAVRTALAAEGIPIRAADTGGKAGRTVLMDVATGKTTVRTPGQDVRDL